MKTHLTKLLLLAPMLPLFAMSGFAINIGALPFTIKKAGTYTLDRNLTFSGDKAITVTASNVVLDLNGYTLTGINGGYAVFGTDVNSVTVQNGTINGFFDGINLTGGFQVLLQNLTVSNASAACIALTTCTTGTIQNCFILGTSSGGVSGIYLGACQGVVVKNNQIANLSVGCESGSSSGNIFIADQLTNCSYGLFLGAPDKYQGNVTIACANPFIGGTPVGFENN